MGEILQLIMVANTLAIRGGDKWLVRHRTVREDLGEFEGMEYYEEHQTTDLRKLYRYALEFTVAGNAEAVADCIPGMWLGTTWERTSHDYADARNNVTGGNASLMRALHDRPAKFAPALYHTVKFGAYETNWDSSQPPPAIASALADAVYGDTLLHIACRRGHREVINELLIGGADVQAKNGEGKTPSDVACSDLTRDTLQLPPADPMLAKILAEFDAVAEAVVPCLPEETRKCDQLLQRLVELVRAARRYKSPEIKKLNARLDRLVEMAYAAHRAKLQGETAEDAQVQGQMTGLIVAPLILYRYLTKLLGGAQYDHQGSGEIDRCAAIAALNKCVVGLDDDTVTRVVDTAQQLGGTADSRVLSNQVVFVIIGLSQGLRQQQSESQPSSGFPELHELSQRMLERYLVQLFRLRKDVKLWEEMPPIVSRSDLMNLLSMSQLNLPTTVIDLLATLAETDTEEVDTDTFVTLVRSIAAGARIAYNKDERVERQDSALERQADIIDKMQAVQVTLREGSEAWTQMGDFTASAQLSLLHTALMQQDGELLGQGAGKEPEALCDSQFGVYANQMDTEVLMAQAASLTERRKIRETAKEVFSILDKKQDGKLSQAECCRVLGDRLGERLHTEMKSHDGSVSFNDWILYFDKQGKRAANNGAADERDYLHKVAVFVSAMRDRLRAMPAVQN